MQLGGAPALSETRADGWRRSIQLGLLATQADSRSRRFRGLFWSELMLAISGVASLIFVAALGTPDVADLVALRLLAYASWLCGGFGLSALLGRADTRSATELARLRGVSLEGWSHFALGVAVRIARGIVFAMLPVFVVAVAILPSQSSAASRWLLLPFLFAFAFALSACLGAVAGVVRRYWPHSPRRAAAGLLLVPWVVSWFFPAVPSVPGWFGLALTRMASFGGALYL